MRTFAAVGVLLALLQDAAKIEVTRQPSGKTMIEGQFPAVPDGAAVDVSVARCVDKPNLASRRMEEVILPKPISEKFVAMRKGKFKIDVVCPVPGFYQVVVDCEPSYPHTETVKALFEKKKIEPFKLSRKVLLGDWKEHHKVMEASLADVQRVTSRIETLLTKLDQPVVDEKDAFGEVKQADMILQDVERLEPVTGLPGTVEFLRIIADQILNYIRFSPKLLANKPAGGDELGGKGPKPPPPTEAPKNPPKTDGKTVGDSVSLGTDAKGTTAQNSKQDKPQMKEPSEFVKRMRALLVHLKWFHLRETALMLIARAKILLETSQNQQGAELDATRAQLQAIVQFEHELGEGKEESAVKYREITTLDEKRSLKIFFDEAFKAVAPEEERAKMKDPPTALVVMGLLEQVDPQIRSFRDPEPKK